MDDREQSRLREMLGRVEGPAAVTLQRAIGEHWERLCWIAEQYGKGPCLETWKDAEDQWGKVAKAAHALNEALGNLGLLAFAIRLDAAVEVPWTYEDVKGCLPEASGVVPYVGVVSNLEEFSLRAQSHSRRMKRECNGSRREDDSGLKAALVGNLLELLKCPKTHIQQIGAAIHAWERRDEQALEPRFAERAIKRVTRPR